MTLILNPEPGTPVADRILDVAKEILGEVGEAGLRIEDVMGGAGVQAPVIYRHFGNREGLVQSAHLARYIAALQQSSETFRAETLAAADAVEFRAVFDRLLDTVLAEEHREASFVRLEVLGVGTQRPLLAEAIRVAQADNYAQPQAALEHAQDQGWIRPDIVVSEFLGWAVSSMLGQAAVAKFRTEPGITDQWAATHRQAIHTVLFGDKI
jgi:AcrR family transcriptional regulator